MQQTHKQSSRAYSRCALCMHFLNMIKDPYARRHQRTHTQHHNMVRVCVRSIYTQCYANINTPQEPTNIASDRGWKARTKIAESILHTQDDGSHLNILNWCIYICAYVNGDFREKLRMSSQFSHTHTRRAYISIMRHRLEQVHTRAWDTAFEHKRSQKGCVWSLRCAVFGPCGRDLIALSASAPYHADRSIVARCSSTILCKIYAIKSMLNVQMSKPHRWTCVFTPPWSIFVNVCWMACEHVCETTDPENQLVCPCVHTHTHISIQSAA